MGDRTMVVHLQFHGGGAAPAVVAENGDADGCVNEGGGDAAMQSAKNVMEGGLHWKLHGQAIGVAAGYAQTQVVVEWHLGQQRPQLSKVERLHGAKALFSHAQEAGMNGPVRSEQQGDVLVVTVDNPPVNAISSAVAHGLVEAVRSAQGEETVRAIVVAGAGTTFIAGADIREFPKIVAGELPPLRLAEMLDEIEDSSKPVVMAIHGMALGGGLEVAMAGHYRIATANARLGQPEVKLGLIPGAGGTQRLPRLIGMEKALEMCAFGEPVSAAEALRLGLIDRIATGDLLAEAVSWAREVPGVRRTRNIVCVGCEAQPFVEEAGRRMRLQSAPLKAIEAVQAAVQPFEAGREAERKLFEECLFGIQSKALIHAFFAERAVSKVPGLEARPLPVRQVAVTGAGTMGTGIAMAFANAGFPVILQDTNEDNVRRGLAAIRGHYERSAAKGKLSADELEQRLSRIRSVQFYEGFLEADLVVEAVPESIELKKHVFRELDQATRPDALLATNTSTLDIDEIASAVRQPGRVFGLHFFSPAHVMRLVEIVRGRQTAPEAVATGLEVVKRLRKVGVVAGNCFGFIGNRMFAPYRLEAVRVVEEGAAPHEVDGALTEWGMAMGPLAVGDLSGLDVAWLIRQEALRLGLPHVPANTVEDWLYARGRYGQKTGLGWYRYDDNRRASPDPEVDSLVAEYAAAQGIPRRAFEPREIRERTLFALVNEGARLLEEGIALRPGDIDITYIHGYGFPAFRGGPMHWASAFGLQKVLDGLERFYDELGPHWKPAPLLAELARQGKGFGE